MTEPARDTTWFANAYGNGHTAHQVYRTRTPGRQPTLATHCGRPLPTPIPAPDDWPRCKTCTRATAATTQHDTPLNISPAKTSSQPTNLARHHNE